MGCGDSCPAPGKRDEEWPRDDPAGLDLKGVGAVRDHIERRVLNLLDDIGVPAIRRT